MLGTLVVIAICAAISIVGWAVPGVLNALFDFLDSALGWMGPLPVVILISAATGVLFIMAFPHVSAQGGIVSVKDKIKHNLLGIRLFQDDMPTVGRGVTGALGWNMLYLSLNALPMVVLAAPFMVVWFQMNALYAFDPIQPEDRVVVVAELKGGIPAADVELQIPENATLINRANMVGKIALTLEAKSEGEGELLLAHSNAQVSKVIAVGGEPKRLARNRTAHPWSDFAHAKDPIIYFGEPVLGAASFVQSIWVEYPPAPLGPFGGGEITIMIIFIIVSMAFGFGLKGVFGVEI
ncbi:MAG: hypothetical protein QGH51_05965 [Planctomycetota bacterium]|nr:hypothetical protein [Planctomycetota bacterium]MDP6941556.1 hypothetical protein [Planctomycetota bacterium]